MKILVVAATGLEIAPFRQYLEEKKYLPRTCRVEVLITGVSMLHTAYELTRQLLTNKPDITIQAGIGGSFHPFYPPGTVVAVKEEITADTGVEEESGFSDLFDMELALSNLPYTGKMLVNPHDDWLDKLPHPKVRGISINEISTRPERIQLLQEKYGAAIESMEGAAFHYVCLQEKVPFIQLRAVSNFVGERDKSQWKMQEAVTNLNEQLSLFVHNLLC